MPIARCRSSRWSNAWNPVRSDDPRAALREVAVVLQNAAGEGVRIASGGALFDLDVVSVRVVDGAFVGGLEYRADLYSRGDHRRRGRRASRPSSAVLVSKTGIGGCPRSLPRRGSARGARRSTIWKDLRRASPRRVARGGGSAGRASARQLSDSAPPLDLPPDGSLRARRGCAADAKALEPIRFRPLSRARRIRRALRPSSRTRPIRSSCWRRSPPLLQRHTGQPDLLTVARIRRRRRVGPRRDGSARASIQVDADASFADLIRASRRQAAPNVPLRARPRSSTRPGGWRGWAGASTELASRWRVPVRCNSSSRRRTSSARRRPPRRRVRTEGPPRRARRPPSGSESSRGDRSATATMAIDGVAYEYGSALFDVPRRSVVIVGHYRDRSSTALLAPMPASFGPARPARSRARSAGPPGVRPRHLPHRPAHDAGDPPL